MLDLYSVNILSKRIQLPSLTKKQDIHTICRLIKKVENKTFSERRQIIRQPSIQ